MINFIWGMITGVLICYFLVCYLQRELEKEDEY